MYIQCEITVFYRGRRSLKGMDVLLLSHILYISVYHRPWAW